MLDPKTIGQTINKTIDNNTKFQMTLLDLSITKSININSKTPS